MKLNARPNSRISIRLVSENEKWALLIKREFTIRERKVLRSRRSPDRNQLGTTPVKAWESIMRNTKAELAKSEEHEAGVGDGGIVLIGDTPIVAKDLAFFCLDQSQQTVDG